MRPGGVIEISMDTSIHLLVLGGAELENRKCLPVTGDRIMLLRMEFHYTDAGISHVSVNLVLLKYSFPHLHITCIYLDG